MTNKGADYKGEIVDVARYRASEANKTRLQCSMGKAWRNLSADRI